MFNLLAKLIAKSLSSSDPEKRLLDLPKSWVSDRPSPFSDESNL
jgi:hypothetical protein